MLIILVDLTRKMKNLTFGPFSFCKEHDHNQRYCPKLHEIIEES